MQDSKDNPSLLDRAIRGCLENPFIVLLAVIFFIVWGVIVAPFNWEISGLPRDPVPVDAIPDIGENQQIIFTQWQGRSPQDVEDQITYPLTVSLLGVPGVATIRSYSSFGFSSIFVVFNEDTEFYWSRSRILEKLSSLPGGTLPEGVRPGLGPDATALGQVFWYTLEGRNEQGEPTGGWDPHELRTAQDWYVRYALQSVEGVSEVASVGGYVQEYQIDVDPDAMRAFDVRLDEVFNAVRMANVDVGARTIEINRVEYVIRGLGFIENIEDIKQSVIKVNDNVPITIGNVAHVSLGPAARRGALDKGGAEAVGGVVVVRYGENPLATITRVKEKIEEIASGLPSKTLEDGTFSQVQIVPFYDRSGLIHETLGTLNTALTEEIMVTIIVVLLLVLHLRSSLLISSLLPLAVLMCFIAMKSFGVDANIVALSGIAIAIGTMVDMGIVICENILRHLDTSKPGEDRLEIVYRATSEVGGAVVTAILTTIVSFLPVFTMEAAEGKLFKPLAFTKSFALIASVIVALFVIPTAARFLFGTREAKVRPTAKPKLVVYGLGLLVVSVITSIYLRWWVGPLIAFMVLYQTFAPKLALNVYRISNLPISVAIAFVVGIALARSWTPLGPERPFQNIVFVVVLIGGLLGATYLFIRFYGRMLRWCLENKTLFLALPVALVLWGGVVWLGFDGVFGFIPGSTKLSATSAWQSASKSFPGLGEEFMPPLDEGSFLFMPTTMPHASIGETMDVLKKQDMAIRAIPEVESVVGKLGRAETPLDPAPVSMIETIVNYKSEYIVDEGGTPRRFRYDNGKGEFERDEKGELIADPAGRSFRQWRPEIKNPDDIWAEIVRVARIPGVTSAPRLQPIAARLVMLQSGMRAPMGIKVYGPDQESIETVGLALERLLKEVPSVEPNAVIADRIVGKPYLEIDIDREAIGRFGMHVRDVQDVIEVAVGGRRVTTTVEGRERYPVRIRYLRELRDQIEDLERILVPARDGSQIPLGQLTEIKYRRGPQVIKSEDTFLVGYVLFDKRPGFSEVQVVEECQAYLDRAIENGALTLPSGVNFKFAGSYENQIRSEERLRLVLPLALFVIFIILYLQFRSISTTLLVFSGILVAWAGGFQMVWLYGQDWFMNFDILGVDARELFQIHPINLSVAVWVGFLALFGIATDNGVILGTYLHQTFEAERPATIEGIREATMTASMRRIRPCLMTSATTILALIPVLTSTGRGADVMVPMAIPSFGGMSVVLVTVFVVPTLYSAIEEFRLRRQTGQSAP